MDAKFTRRELAAALAAALPAGAQTAADPSAGDFDAISKAQIKQNSDLLAKAAVPMPVEPSFVFKP